MDKQIARQIVELYREIDYLSMIDRTPTQEIELVWKESELDRLIAIANRQELIERAIEQAEGAGHGH